MASTSFEEFVYELRIPKDRVAVLIGTEGKVKRDLERSTKTQIEVDSKEGFVKIKGKDALLLYLCREIVKAVGRGFSPDTAKLLLKQDYGLDIIPVMQYARNQDDIARLRGRVIGEQGRSRKAIEDLTETNICVYGKTIGIIGRLEYLAEARHAVTDLLSGATHASVYKWLEKKRKMRRYE
ncbi:KH domain-containing protein [Candidatus Woesearchaeota archaeon]|nr:KH domain-containing protein [Candidatus Woesearchaeota archaeon]